MKNKNKKGFTLVELLVVIAIIGILSSVAVINLTSVREGARVATMVDNLNQLETIMVLCLNDDKELLFDYPKQAEKWDEQEAGGSHSGWDIELCEDSYEYDSSEPFEPILWPDFLNYGYLYDSVASNPEIGEWEIILLENGGVGPGYIYCSNNGGCVSE